MFRGDKRGQFFLLAAVIIVAGIIALASVKTFVSDSNSEDAERVYDLSKELGYESSKVIDFGIYNQTYGDALIEDWLDIYTNYTSQRDGVSEWLFVYGNASEVKMINFTAQSQGSVDLSFGDKKISASAKPILIKEKTSLGSYASPSAQIVVRDTLGIERKFTLNPGENFYFVVAKVEEGDTIIQKND